MPKMSLPRKLLPLVKKKKRYKVVIGGRGSGKSHSVADICLMDAQTNGIKTACFREYMNSMADSVHSLLKDEIERLGLQGFESLNNNVRHSSGGEFVFRGLARNLESIKSMHGFERFWVEEAQTISYDSIKILSPTLRTEGSEIWLIGNPKSSADPFSQRFIIPFKDELDRNGYYEDDLHLIIVCNYEDNPFFPDVLEEERAYDEQNLSRAEYNHIWRGHFNDTVANAIIPVEWFDACIDAHEKLGFKPLGAKIASHDPSDEGADSKGYALRQGSIFTHIVENEDGDVNDGADWAAQLAIDHGADYFLWDVDGMGIGLKRQINEAFNGIKCETLQFSGAGAVDDPDDVYDEDDRDTSKRQPRTNKETFRNRRAQYYWRMRDRFRATYKAVTEGVYTDPDKMISLSSDIEHMDKLRSEVCRIPLKTNNNGMIQIMAKPEMAKLGISSPNMSDAMMQCMFAPNPIKRAKQAPIKRPRVGVV